MTGREVGAAFYLPPKPRVLVVNMRRIGDLLLTTPLMRTLRHAYPDARLDVLVFAGTEAILSGNPDIDGVIAIAPQPGAWAMTRLVARLWRRYDLVIATQSGDRPALLAWIAGRKRRLFDVAVVSQPRRHRLIETLALVAPLGLSPRPEVVCPESASPDVPDRDRPYAVLHAAPMFGYRRWTDEGWRALARALGDRGLRVVATGGPDAAERAYLDAVWSADAVPVERMDGRLNWSQLTALLRDAAVYVGPDTSVTHLAAASGCETVALFGPTDPRIWGPWPASGLDAMWEAARPLQHRGNVRLLQTIMPCVPCQEEGCERRLDSASACLSGMAPDRVMAAVDEALQSRQERGGWRPAAKAGMESPS
jgi:heptosyltransferase-3